MLNTNAFDYINVLDKAADASWMRNEVIANNIANATIPGYKREDVAFESALRKALGYDGSESMDEKVRKASRTSLNPMPYIDNAGLSYRLDGNNVDIENENVMMAENQLKYQGLMNGIQTEFSNLQMVMK